jgi:hypothetical protein
MFVILFPRFRGDDVWISAGVDPVRRYVAGMTQLLFLRNISNISLFIIFYLTNDLPCATDIKKVTPYYFFVEAWHEI